MDINQITRELQRLQSTIETAAQAGLIEAAELVKNEAKAWLGHEHSEWPPLAEATTKEKAERGYPEDPLIRTGELRDSIEVRVHGMTAEIGTDHEYARYLEHGTSRMPPRPFLQPALTTKTNEVGMILERHIGQALKKVG